MAIAAQSRILFQNVLIATDFSACSRAVLPYARSLALQYDSTLFLAHVIPTETVGLEANVESTESIALHEMEDLESDENLQGLRHIPLIETGDAWHVLRELVLKLGMDLVIIGTHGRTGLSKIVMGSVAESIFRSAPCPVLTIGPNVPSYHDGDFKHLLCAIDPNSRNHYAELLAASMAQKRDARLTLMHVAETNADADLAKPMLELIASEFKTIQPPDTLVQAGERFQKILNAAAARQADLIVLGVDRPTIIPSHLTELAYRVVLGAPVNALMTGEWETDAALHLAYRMVCEAPCPVLTVGLGVEKPAPR